MNKAAASTLAILLTSSLVASAQSSPPTMSELSAWVSETLTDEVSGKPFSLVSTNSINMFMLNWPYSGPQRATIQVRKHPRWGTDAIVTVSNGQLHCEYRNCIISVRFDDGPVRRYAVTEPSDNSSDTWFIDDASGFIARLKKSKRTWIELQFFQQGNRTLEFQTDGFPSKK